MDKTLRYRVLGQDVSAGKTLDDVGKKAGKTGGKLGALGGSIKGGLIGMAASMTVGAIVDGFNSLVDGASDLNETVNKSKTIFGDGFGAVDKWAKGAAKGMGLSRREALNAAAGFGDMFQQIGFSSENASKFSRDVVQMSADLGSFNNLPTADVTERMSAAFRGEYDSLQALIPNINAARVEKVALAETGKKSAKALTAEEKAMAVLAIVSKDGARAQGDFAKTSGDLANRQKIQAARAEELGNRFGQMLIPIKQLALDGFDKLMSAAEPVTEWLEKNPAVMDGVKAAFSGVVGVVEFLANVLGAVLGPVIVLTAKGFALLANLGASLLDSLGNVPGFEWAKGAAANLRTMAAGADAAADGISNIGKQRVIVNTKTAENNVTSLRKKIDGIKGKIVTAKAKGDTKEADRLTKKLRDMRKEYKIALRVYKTGIRRITVTLLAGGAAGAKIGSFRSGGRPRVGEIAQFHKDEFWVPDTAGTVISQARSRSMMGNGPGGMGGGDQITIMVQGDTDPDGAARRIEEILTRRKATRGRLNFL